MPIYGSENDKAPVDAPLIQSASCCWMWSALLIYFVNLSNKFKAVHLSEPVLYKLISPFVSSLSAFASDTNVW